MRRKEIDPQTAKDVHEFCRLVREKTKLTQPEFEGIVGTQFQNISAIERGKRYPNNEYIKKLKKFCNEKEWNHVIHLLFD